MDPERVWALCPRKHMQDCVLQFALKGRHVQTMSEGVGIKMGGINGGGLVKHSCLKQLAGGSILECRVLALCIAAWQNSCLSLAVRLWLIPRNSANMLPGCVSERFSVLPWSDPLNLLGWPPRCC